MECPVVTAAFYVLSALLALMLGAAGIAKLSGTTRMRQAAERFAIPWSRYRLIGFVEIVAVVGLAAGIAFRPLGLAAGIGSVALLVGALTYHRRVHDPMSQMAGALLTLALAAAYLATGFVTA